MAVTVHLLVVIDERNSLKTKHLTITQAALYHYQSTLSFFPYNAKPEQPLNTINISKQGS